MRLRTDRPRAHRSREEGAGSVVAVAAITLVLAVGGVGASVAEAVALRHLAAVAADAGALAAAARAPLGAPTACDTAARVARMDGARLERCELAGAVATVSVSAAAPSVFGWLGVARLNARAGPAETYREKPAPLEPPS